MIRKEGDSIILDGKIRAALNFNDSTLSDDDFIATLIEELVYDDKGVRAGSTPSYKKEVLEGTAEVVLQLVEEQGVRNRNTFITAAYNNCSNSLPEINGRFEFRPRPFLKGSDFANKFSRFEKN